MVRMPNSFGWHQAAITGRNKAILKGYFERAGVPWIYDKPFNVADYEKPIVPEEDVDMNSPYNRKPKGTKHFNSFESRVAQIRKNLSTADDRLEQHRISRLTNKKKPICDQMDIILHKTLLTEANAAKF